MPDRHLVAPSASAQTPHVRVAAPPRRTPKPADPCVMVIFGATGDLTKRLLVPALYNLARTGILPDKFAILGIGRAERSEEEWRGQLREMLDSFVGNASAEFNVDHIDDALWQKLAARMSFVQGDINSPQLYRDLGGALDKAAAAHGTGGNVIFYLAVADHFFGPVVDHLGKAKLTEEGKKDEAGKAAFWRRVVIEKPFGHDVASARALNARIRRVLNEDQIFRIDHFLGKDTVQSIMAFRFANGLFEPIWNRDRIDHVQITAAETVGVEARGKFYEATGALRDMVPNHMLSLLSMVAMEPPAAFDAASIRSRKADVFAAMPAADPARAARGQYGAGTVLGKAARAYRDEPDVAKRTKVETYAALRLEIDNWRWAGVPFYVRTGKHLARRVTEIAIRFKPAPYQAFEGTPIDGLPPNWLVLRIAPDDGISLQFEVKRPGPIMDLAAVKMDFRTRDWFPKEPNVGYETLIYDVMIGDPTLFMRADMVEQGWRIVQPVLDAWTADKSPPEEYASGADGPAAAAKLLAEDGGREWRPVAAPEPAEANAREKKSS
jgi:glucose-6-phosphate 1-dehydrogenase